MDKNHHFAQQEWHFRLFLVEESHHFATQERHSDDFGFTVSRHSVNIWPKSATSIAARVRKKYIYIYPTH